MARWSAARLCALLEFRSQSTRNQKMSEPRGGYASYLGKSFMSEPSRCLAGMVQFASLFREKGLMLP